MVPTTTRREEVQARISLGRRLLTPHTLISFALAFALLYFLFVKADIDLGQTVEVLRSANPFIYLLAFLVQYSTFPLRGWRWRVLLRNARFDDPPPLRDLTEIVFLSFFVNTLVPAKLGDLYRGYLLKRSTGVSFPKTIGTIVAERFNDLVILVGLMGVISLFGFGGHLPGTILQTLGMGILLILVAGLGLLAMKGVRKYIHRLLPARLRPVYVRFEEGVFLSFRRFPLLVSLTLLIWLMEGGRLILSAHALRFPLEPFTGLFIAMGAALLTVLPITPAGLGFVESGIVAMLLLAGELGLMPEVDTNLAFSIAILDRLACYWSIVFLGSLVYLVSRKTK